MRSAYQRVSWPPDMRSSSATAGSSRCAIPAGPRVASSTSRAQLEHETGAERRRRDLPDRRRGGLGDVDHREQDERRDQCRPAGESSPSRTAAGIAPTTTPVPTMNATGEQAGHDDEQHDDTASGGDARQASFSDWRMDRPMSIAQRGPCRVPAERA